MPLCDHLKHWSLWLGTCLVCSCMQWVTLVWLKLHLCSLWVACKGSDGTPSGSVIMYDPLSCKMFVTIPGYYCLLGGVLYITCIPIGNRLLIACAWFLLVSLVASTWGLTTCGLAAAFPTCIQAPSDIDRSDLSCLVHSSSIGNYKPLSFGFSCTSSEQCRIFSWFLGFGQQAFHNPFLLIQLIDDSMVSFFIWLAPISSVACLNCAAV